jgi:hypothetical protein
MPWIDLGVRSHFAGRGWRWILRVDHALGGTPTRRALLTLALLLATAALLMAAAEADLWNRISGLAAGLATWLARGPP